MGSPFEQGLPVRLVQCTITSTSPLTVTILGQAGVSAVGINGVTYTTGTANAFVMPVGKPLIWPIG